MLQYGIFAFRAWRARAFKNLPREAVGRVEPVRAEMGQRLAGAAPLAGAERRRTPAP